MKVYASVGEIFFILDEGVYGFCDWGFPNSKEEIESGFSRYMSLSEKECETVNSLGLLRDITEHFLSEYSIPENLEDFPKATIEIK